MIDKPAFENGYEFARKLSHHLVMHFLVGGRFLRKTGFDLFFYRKRGIIHLYFTDKASAVPASAVE